MSEASAVLAVQAVMPLVPRQVAPGLRIAQLTPEALGAPLDPFLMCDCFWMEQPFFPPHPHAGFSAVTYILPESPGGFVNRDSLGDRSLILPGGLHWTEAARGMLHEEVPIERGRVARGLQIFVNLPAARKLEPPRVYHLEPQQVPGWQRAGVQARVLAGSLGEVHSPVQTRTECALVDVTLHASASVALPFPSGWRAFGVLTAGRLHGHDTQALAAVRFDAADAVPPAAGPVTYLAVRAADTAVRLVLLAGRALREPVAFGGPFVMNTAAQLLEAKRRYAAGDMGQLAPSF